MGALIVGVAIATGWFTAIAVFGGWVRWIKAREDLKDAAKARWEKTFDAVVAASILAVILLAAYGG